jgi:hypothetical protein
MGAGSFLEVPLCLRATLAHFVLNFWYIAMVLAEVQAQKAFQSRKCLAMAIFLLFAILLSTSNCVGFASSISDGSVSRSRQACKLAREYLAGTTVNSNSLEGYVDPQSPLYSDRVEAYWYTNSA